MNIFPKLLTALVVATLSVVSSVGYAQEQEGKSRWTLQPDGSIKWIVADSSLPHDDHDIPVDVLVTEGSIWRCRKL